MGWNQGYTILEKTIIDMYDFCSPRDIDFNKDLLSVLLEPYRDTDIDIGGSKNLKSIFGGWSAMEIIIMTYGLKLPKKLDPEAVWTDEQELLYETYIDKLHSQFYKVTKKFGF